MDPHAPTSHVRAPENLLSLIGGSWISGATESLVRDLNPSSPSVILAEGTSAGAEDLDAAVSAAGSALPGWRDVPAGSRARVLWDAAQILESRCVEWGELLSREEGKTAREGIAEIGRAADVLRFYAGEPLRATGEVLASNRSGETILVEHRPVGVVAVITPFNFPIAIPAWKTAAALAYGNTVVWKPAETVPLLAMRFAQALQEAGLPAGVLNLLIGSGDLGRRLVEHPGISAVTFTGSTVVGHEVIAACGRRRRPVQAEMGGVNPAVVLPGADLEEAATMIVAGAFASSGQKCTATSRLVVHDEIADGFMDEVIEQAARWSVGDPLDPATDMGPVISAAARSSIHAAIKEGIAEGATLLAGGEADEPPATGGYFVVPTILQLADHRQPLWESEIFGPVLTLARATTVDGALEMASQGPFGLAASVFTHDLVEVARARAALDVGILHINSETTGADPHAPFGGVGESGYGPKEQGRAARDFFTHTRTTYLRPF
jgi:aldehyde dehydrogenase (NAD+)